MTTSPTGGLLDGLLGGLLPNLGSVTGSLSNPGGLINSILPNGILGG